MFIRCAFSIGQVMCSLGSLAQDNAPAWVPLGMVVGSGEEAETAFSSFLDGDLSRCRSGPSPDLLQEHMIRTPCVDRPTPQMRPTAAAGSMTRTVSAGIQDELCDGTQEEESACCDREEEEAAGGVAPCWHEVVANIVTNPCTGG